MKSVRKSLVTIAAIIAFALNIAAQTVVIPNPNAVPKGQILRKSDTSINTEGQRRFNFNGQAVNEIGEFALRTTTAFGGPYTGSYDAWSENGRAATEAYASTIAQSVARGHLPTEFGIPGYFGNETTAVYEMINNGKVRFFHRTDAGIDPGQRYVTKAETYYDRTIGAGFFPWLMGDQPVPHVISLKMAFANSNIEYEIAKFKFTDNNTLEVISVNPMIEVWQNRRRNQPAHYGTELQVGMTVKVWSVVKNNGQPVLKKDGNQMLAASPIFWWFKNSDDQRAVKSVWPEVERGDNHIAGNENLTLVLLAPTVYRFMQIDSTNPGQGGSQDFTDEVGMPGNKGWAPYNLRMIR